jgi:hypothetical protein
MDASRKNSRLGEWPCVLHQDRKEKPQDWKEKNQDRTEKGHYELAGGMAKNQSQAQRLPRCRSRLLSLCNKTRGTMFSADYFDHTNR